MSISYKKPWFTDSGRYRKFAKKQANKKVRKALDVPSGDINGSIILGIFVIGNFLGRLRAISLIGKQEWNRFFLRKNAFNRWKDLTVNFLNMVTILGTEYRENHIFGIALSLKIMAWDLQ